MQAHQGPPGGSHYSGPPVATRVGDPGMLMMNRRRFAGAATAVIIRSILSDDALALFAGACMTWILRAGSLYFGWHLPVYKSRPPRV